METANTNSTTGTFTNLKLAAALLSAQEEFTAVVKDASNPAFRSKYATLESVISAVRPALQKNGLLVMQRAFNPAQNGGNPNDMGIRTILLHVPSGEFESNELTAPATSRGNFDIQSIGSTITYLRRYEYLTILGLAPEDDDGNAAAGKDTPKATSPQSVQPEKRGTPAEASYRPKPSPNIPTTAIPAPPAHDPAPVAPQPIPVSTTPVVTTAVSTPAADPNGLPTKEQYDAYINRAVKLTADLEKAGLRAGQGLPTKTKLKKYIFHAAKVADLKSLTVAQWDTLFTEFEKVLSTGGDKELIGYIEKANAKEGK